LKDQILDDQPDNIKALAERLSECPDVTRYDGGDEKEAWVLAISFGELEGSFNKFLYEQLPKLTNNQATPSELYEVLLDIGEEFRHIMYHIRDPKFYRYLDNAHESDKI
jgi:hypothetical protein